MRTWRRSGKGGGDEEEETSLMMMMMKAPLATLPRLTYHDRVGDVRVGCVWLIAIYRMDAPEDCQADGSELCVRAIE